MVRKQRKPWGRLNPSQREAVHQIDGPLLILAGAGTGKTRVITSRIAYLVHQNVAPSSILAVTFTNKAANEMRERVTKMIRREEARQLTICTFHSLCVRILRKSIERLGYTPNFTIYTSSDQRGLIRRIIARHAARKERLEPGLAIALISKAKNSGISVSDSPDSLLAEVYRAYGAELKSLNAVDFDDLLLLAVNVLETHSDVRDEWQRRFRYLMVDEFQDTNGLQMRLLQQLGQTHHNICVVGDDDQSIYGWRGAEVSNILEFERFFPSPTIVKLEENYRSTVPILETANGLIRHNSARREKMLWTRKTDDRKVRLIALPGENEEAKFIVNEIWEARHIDGRPWEDFAVLFRMNLQSRAFEQALRERQIPYRLIGGQSFFDRREVKDLLAYLTVFCNPHDDVNLLRVLNTPPRGIGKSAIERAMQAGIVSGASVYATLRSTDFVSKLGTQARRAVGKFIELVESYRQTACEPNADYAGLTERLMQAIDYPGFLGRSCRTDEEKEARRRALDEFLQGLRHSRERQGKDLQTYLHDVALTVDKEADEDIESKKGVCLITLHAAKGLEFPVVYLTGLEEGILPHRRSLDDGTRDEERRLLYVGITRAQRELTLSYCRARVRYGEPVPCQPSTFLRELGSQHLEEVDYETLAGAPATEDEARRTFTSLKAMLEGIEGHTVD